jgi:hypothetical protein
MSMAANAGWSRRLPKDEESSGKSVRFQLCDGIYAILMLHRIHFRMPMLRAEALNGASQELNRLLHPGNAVLRRAIQANLVSFPSQIPVFSRQARPEMQWKAVSLYFVLGWSLCDIAARFGVGSHRISKVVDEWATRAIALGYIQIIDPEGFETWNGTEAKIEAVPAPRLEEGGSRGPSLAASRSCFSRAGDEPVEPGWRAHRGPEPANIALVAALDIAIRGCESRKGQFFGQAAALLRGLRTAVEANNRPESAQSVLPTSDFKKLYPAPSAPAKEVLYAFNS